MKIQITFNNEHKEIVEGENAFDKGTHISVENILFPKQFIQSVARVIDSPEELNDDDLIKPSPLSSKKDETP